MSISRKLSGDAASAYGPLESTGAGIPRQQTGASTFEKAKLAGEMRPGILQCAASSTQAPMPYRRMSTRDAAAIRVQKSILERGGIWKSYCLKAMKLFMQKPGTREADVFAAGAAISFVIDKLPRNCQSAAFIAFECLIEDKAAPASSMHDFMRAIGAIKSGSAPSSLQFAFEVLGQSLYSGPYEPLLLDEKSISSIVDLSNLIAGHGAHAAHRGLQDKDWVERNLPQASIFTPEELVRFVEIYLLINYRSPR